MRTTEQFNVNVRDMRFVLSIHTRNPAHEARIQWKIPSQDLCGEWGRLYLPADMPGGADQIIQEPTLAFGSDESICINGQEQSSITLPRSLALQLQEILDDLGTATSNTGSICDEPSQFPPDIQYRTQISEKDLNKISWNEDQRIMWYSFTAPQDQNEPSRLAELLSAVDMYAYQIEDGELIHRTEEYPSSEAVDKLKQLLQQAVPSDERLSTDSYQIDEPLE